LLVRDPQLTWELARDLLQAPADVVLIAQFVAVAVVDPDVDLVDVPVELPTEVADAGAGGGAVGRVAVGGCDGDEGENGEQDHGEKLHLDDVV